MILSQLFVDNNLLNFFLGLVFVILDYAFILSLKLFLFICNEILCIQPTEQVIDLVFGSLGTLSECFNKRITHGGVSRCVHLLIAASNFAVPLLKVDVQI